MYLVIENMPPTRHEREIRRGVEGEAGIDACRDVEAAVVGERAGVFAEGGHEHRRCAGEADAQIGQNRVFDADAQAAAEGPVIAVVGEVIRVPAIGPERLQPLDVQDLRRDGRRDADCDRPELARVVEAHKDLTEVDAGGAVAERAAEGGDDQRAGSEGKGGDGRHVGTFGA